jgi:hypothetical protein
MSSVIEPQSAAFAEEIYDLDAKMSNEQHRYYLPRDHRTPMAQTPVLPEAISLGPLPVCRYAKEGWACFCVKALIQQESMRLRLSLFVSAYLWYRC